MAAHGVFQRITKELLSKAMSSQEKQKVSE